MLDLDQAITTAAVIAPFVVGLVQITKQIGLVDKFAGLVAVLYGLILAFLVASTEAVGELDGVDMWKRTALTGIIAGLTAAGAYSAVKAASRDV